MQANLLGSHSWAAKIWPKTKKFYRRWDILEVGQSSKLLLHTYWVFRMSKWLSWAASGCFLFLAGLSSSEHWKEEMQTREVFPSQKNPNYIMSGTMADGVQACLGWGAGEQLWRHLCESGVSFRWLTWKTIKLIFSRLLSHTWIARKGYNSLPVTKSFGEKRSCELQWWRNNCNQPEGLGDNRLLSLQY